MSLGDIASYLQAFDEEEVDHQAPNARHLLTGSLFVCHAGADFDRIVERIAYPVLMDRFGDGYFLHNLRSGASNAYKILVRAALRWCDKFLVVISRNVVNHDWVRAELDWLLTQRRTLVLCLFDDTDPKRIHPALDAVVNARLSTGEALAIDFRGDQSAAQQALGRVLDRVIHINPYPRFPNDPAFRE